MPRLSILIPCLGGAAEFDGTLVSVLQNRPAGCEILVVHTEPYDDPYNLAGEVRFVRASGRTVVELVNEGTQAAKGEVLNILACGLEVSENWTTPALAHFADDEVAAVAPTLLDRDRQPLAAGVRWTLGGARKLAVARSFQVVAPLLAAGFWRRSAVLAHGGFEATLGDDLADVGLGLALRELGLKTVCEPKSQLTAIIDPLPLHRANSLHQGQRAERLFWRFAAHAGLGLALASHPFTILADLLSRLPTAGALLNPLGRLLACCEFGAQGRYLSHLNRCAERLSGDSSTPATVSLAEARAEAQAKSAASISPARSRRQAA
ncbi:MAG: glycosyltransferase family 2 protein [Pirellulaceae bacterium]|nr:glycosyltransferase family 2 protein [Pirellulaceae bacterium]